MAEVVEKLSREDIVQQYRRNLVVYKGEPVFVSEVDARGSCYVTFIRSGKEDLVAFNLKDFKAPVFRLGMMNIMGSVVYLTRIPIRRMNIGLNGENLIVGTLRLGYPQGEDYTTDNVYSLRCPEFAHVFDNKYPTLVEALDSAKANNGGCAFDKQFAVDKNENVFYKTKKVGSAKDCTKTEDIVFDKDFNYLSLLLDGNYEKTVGISCA